MTLETSEIFIIVALIVALGMFAFWYFFKRNDVEYEYTEEYLNNIAEFRDGTLTLLANTIIGQLAMFAPEDGPKFNCYQSGENTSLVRLEFMGNREVSFEVDWSVNKVYLVMQKTVTLPDTEPEIIKHETTFHLTQGTVVDKQIIVKALNKWETKIYDISKAHLDEIFETIAETGNVYQALDEEQRRRLIFSILEDMSNIVVQNRRCTKKELNVFVSRLFAYVLVAYKEQFMQYLNNEYNEGIEVNEETIEK